MGHRFTIEKIFKPTGKKSHEEKFPELRPVPPDFCEYFVKSQPVQVISKNCLILYNLLMLYNFVFIGDF